MNFTKDSINLDPAKEVEKIVSRLKEAEGSILLLY